jgi:hypothetical protein
MVSTAEDVIERHSSDILGDNSFSEAKQLVAFGSTDMLKVQGVIAETEKSHLHIPACGGKLLAAIRTWSASRLEEQWEDVQSVVSTCVDVLRHGIAHLTSKMVQDLSYEMMALSAAHDWNNLEAEQQEAKTKFDKLFAVAAICKDIVFRSFRTQGT